MTTPALEVNCDGTPPPDPGGGSGTAIPQNLTGTPDQNADTVFLDWSDVAGATSYNIYSNWKQDGVVREGDQFVGSTDVSESLRGPLADNSTYEYWVTSIVDGVESADSDRITVVLGTDGSGGDTDPPPDDGGGSGGGDVPVGTQVVFVGNYNTGDFSQWGTIQQEGYNSGPGGYDQNYRAQVVADGSGHETAARFEVRSGDVPPFGGGERSEVRGGPDVFEGDERWYEFSLKVDADFRGPQDGWCILMQWHAGSGSPPMCLEASEDGQTLRIHNNRSGGYRREICPLDPGNWHDYVMHVIFSNNDSDGLIEIWQDGVLKDSYNAANMASSSNYLKQGLYRSSESFTQVVWHDGLRMTAP